MIQEHVVKITVKISTGEVKKIFSFIFTKLYKQLSELFNDVSFAVGTRRNTLVISILLVFPKLDPVRTVGLFADSFKWEAGINWPMSEQGDEKEHVLCYKESWLQW